MASMVAPESERRRPHLPTIGDRPTAGFVPGVPIPDVVERLLAHMSRRILRCRRARIEWRVPDAPGLHHAQILYC
jgi:hypothetical protein